MLYGLDLFSGIGGITLALRQWVRPVAYCENDRYAQGVLLSRMADGELPRAPIWDDVTTLKGSMLPGGIDIIYGGFPCQDISVAGKRVGITGERSGLVSEIWRLADELRPGYIFLENVAAIVTTGFDTVLASLAQRGFDAQWLCLSAADVGACHLRNRWWLLAHATRERVGDGRLQSQASVSSGVQTNADIFSTQGTDPDSNARWQLQPGGSIGEVRRWTGNGNRPVDATYSNGEGLARRHSAELQERGSEWASRQGSTLPANSEGAELAGSISEARRSSQCGKSGGKG